MNDIKSMCMEVMRRRMNTVFPMPIGGTGHSMNVDEFVRLMSDFWREVNDGKREIPQGMAEGICTMVNAMLDVRLAGNDLCAAAITEHELHERYHKTIEKIRSVNGLAEKQRLVNEHFTNLTEGERKVLMYKVGLKPEQTVARELGMSEDAFCEDKKNLMHRLKH
jgi:hypothetical protein